MSDPKLEEIARDLRLEFFPPSNPSSLVTGPLAEARFLAALEEAVGEKDKAISALDAQLRKPEHNTIWILDQVYALFLKDEWIDEMIALLFPHADPTYRNEWRHTFSLGFAAVWSKLDDENKARFVARIDQQGYRARIGLNPRAMLLQWTERGERIAELKWEVERSNSNEAQIAESAERYAAENAELKAERDRLREATDLAIRFLNEAGSADGSGHRDWARRVAERAALAQPEEPSDG